MDNHISDNQLLLYRSLFKGREDIFAMHWAKGTKSGYAPAKLYDPYINRVYKKDTKSRSSENINYLPLTDEQFRRHFNGRQLIGLYPLLEDNTSWFIVADFDKNSWLEDCRIFLKLCEDYKIPAYLERSRSGKGGHIWIFFEQPYLAFKSRKIVLMLLEQSGVVSAFDKNSSFDRLFPNQDSLSGKGFGNLIALPFYKTAMELSNSCFVDPQTAIPYANQWQFLSNIKRAPVAHLDQIYILLTNNKGGMAVTDESSKLTITLSNIIQINRKGMELPLITFLKDELNFFNTEFVIKRNSGRSTFGTERYFNFIEEANGQICIPKGFIRKLFNCIRPMNYMFDC